MAQSLQNITDALNSLAPSSRMGMVRDISRILSDRIIKVIDTHNTSSIIFIFQQDTHRYVLKAEYGMQNATTKEILWYKSVKDHSIAPEFIHSHEDARFSFLLLDYIENAITLEELMRSSSHSDEEILDYIDLALFRNKELFLKSRPARANKEVASAFYLNKYDERLKEALDFPYLRKLHSHPGITINGRICGTPSQYIHKIRENAALHNYLTPDSLGLIHGDLHFGNILIGTRGMYFIDPNGTLGLPIEYDYGKLLHSVHGCYGQIMQGSYSLIRHGEGHYAFQVEGSERLSLAFRRLQTTFTEKELLRGLYAEALHFATMLPHHAARQRETTALFLRSVEIFDDLFTRMELILPL